MRIISAFILSCVLVTARLTPALGTTGDAPKSQPHMQIINGSRQTIDIYWLLSATNRILNGSVEPAKRNHNHHHAGASF